jgi:ABC-type Mn2+/Zn2+ transport system permease subunit
LIEDFFNSWELFHNTYLAGWAITVVLSLVGVLVVSRDQIFLGAAVSQASTFGIALALWLENAFQLGYYPWFREDVFHTAIGGGFSVLASLLTARASERHRETHEATTGWIFLFAASGAVLMVAHSPHGLEEVQRLMASTIIGATITDVWTFTIAGALTVGALWLFGRKLILLMIDPEMAGSSGLRILWWETAIYIWLGMVVGLSIHVAGMIYAFGCLVLPALIAKNFCREIRSIFFAAPAIALASGVVAFALANEYDYPPGQVAIALLCSLLALARVARRAVIPLFARRLPG